MNFGKKENSEFHIRFCGTGGMGVILASIILGTAAILENKNAIQTQSYGAEQRGTRVKSDVIISNRDKINYPVINEVDFLIAFSEDAFNYFYSSTTRESKILINSNLIHFSENKGNIYKIPANDLASELKFMKGINFIMLGGLIKISNLVSNEFIYQAIKQNIPVKFWELNFKAYQKGYDYL
ncbi:MAG: 2-oxoacid:acceptor oxidoreductase family protein [Promethearchaeota archaeon]